jgi:serpin B
LFAATIARAAPVSDTVAAAGAVNGLAVKLQQALPANGNSLISPWSLQSALGMLYAGADAPVTAEMARALGLPPESPALHASFHALRESLLTQAEGTPPLLLNSANRVVMQPGFPIGSEWLNTLKTRYAADAVQLDLSKESEKSLTEINDWVKRQTQGKIARILDHLDSETQLVLLNAVYLDMTWDERFTKELTKNQPFHLTSKADKIVPLMFKQHRMRYARKPGYQIAALPYAGGRMQFTVLVPDAVDGLPAMVAALTPALLGSCAALPEKEVRLSLPRLKMQYAPPGLPNIFKELGMKLAFAPGAGGGFARIGPNLRVCQIVHKTSLELDEDGSKAAAATAIVVAKNGVPREVLHQVVKADRPFLFMIQHVPTGACIFLGRCANPDDATTGEAATPPRKS